MTNTVYMLGAGVNQAAKDNQGLSPPLINDFFQVAMKKRSSPINTTRIKFNQCTTIFKDTGTGIGIFWHLIRSI